jgi:hypothetical protein
MEQTPSEAEMYPEGQEMQTWWKGSEVLPAPQETQADSSQEIEPSGQ